MRKVFAGVDIGGTKTAVVLSVELPHVLGRKEFPTLPEFGPAQTLENIVHALDSLLSDEGFSRSGLHAIGVSCGGPLDAHAGIVKGPPNLPTWTAVPICSFLESEFGVPSFLENDANAGALAEARFGAGVGLKNFIFLTMGTGFGAGLILDGRLYRGSTFSGGEIGHVRLSDEGPLGYGKAGSVEGWASGGGMAQLALARVQGAEGFGRKSVLAHVLASQGKITAKDVALAAAVGDTLAEEIIHEVGERLGEALSILIDILDPDCIAIGGLALRLGEKLFEPARKVIEREALELPRRHCKIVPARLDERIGDLAALCVGFDSLARVASASIHEL